MSYIESLVPRRLWLTLCRLPWLPIFAMGAGLGLLFFLATFGFDVVNPTHIDWLLVGGDLKQHYVGWYFFRQSQWTFPPGLVAMLSYPNGISVAYLDSIPLLAVPFKALSPLLPETFQYFGIWGLVSYMLQGGLSAVIVRHWTRKVSLILLVSSLIIVSPIMFSRMFEHTALAGHWIILLSMAAVVYRRHLLGVWKFVIVWSIILTLAATIHPYFVPMSAFFMIISIILTHDHWLKSGIEIIAPFMMPAIVFGLLGGYEISSSGGNQLGYFSFNLISPINPNNWVYPEGWSILLPPKQVLSDSWETFNYLGLGTLTLVLAGLGVAGFDLWQIRPKMRMHTMRKILFNPRHLAIGGLVIGLLLLAASPQVQYGTRLIMEYPVPHKIEQIWSTFRSSGRLFWPIYYVLTLGLPLYFICKFQKKSATILTCLLMAIVSIQVIDVYAAGGPRGKVVKIRANTQAHYSAPLHVAAWSPYVRDKKHLIFLDGEHGLMSGEMFNALTDVTMKYNLTMNAGYFARPPQPNIVDNQQHYRAQIQNGQLHISDQLFITQDPALVKLAEPNYQLEWQDGYALIWGNK